MLSKVNIMAIFIIIIVSADILVPLHTRWYTDTMTIKIWSHKWQSILLAHSQLKTGALYVTPYTSFVRAVTL